MPGQATSLPNLTEVRQAVAELLNTLEGAERARTHASMQRLKAELDDRTSNGYSANREDYQPA